MRRTRPSIFALMVATLSSGACKVRQDTATVKDDAAPAQQINGVPVPRNLTAVINCISALPFVPAPVAAAVQAAAGDNGQLPADFITNPPPAVVVAIAAVGGETAQVMNVTNSVLQCAVNLPVVALANLIAPWYNAVQARLDQRYTAPPVGNSAAVDRYDSQGFCHNSGGYCCSARDCTTIGTCHLSATGYTCTDENNFYGQLAATLRGMCNWQVTCTFKYASFCILGCTQTTSYGVSRTLPLNQCSPSSLGDEADAGCRGMTPSGYDYDHDDGWIIDFVP